LGFREEQKQDLSLHEIQRKSRHCRKVHWQRMEV